jgi:chromosome partitioning protein
MRTIAIVNQKGGCGKTTSAINLAGVFAASGYKTLLVDMDPQSHCAAGLAIPEQRIDVQIGDAMASVGTNREVDMERLLWRVSRNLDLAPSTMKLATIEAARGELAGKSDAESRLSKVLHRLGNKHDICFIDCSPAIGLLTYNALAAADEVIIPVETGFFSLQGATKQVNTIRSLAKRLGAAPVYRLLATLHNPDSALACELLEELKRRFPGKVVSQVIRFDQRLRESASFGQPIIEYAPDSSGAEDYRGLAQWLAENRPTASMRRAQELPVDSVMGDVAQDLMGDAVPAPEVIVPPAGAGSATTTALA